MAKTGRVSDAFVLRMPDGMREIIKEAASESGRSMNAEIINMITKYYEQKVLIDQLYSKLAQIEVGKYMDSAPGAEDVTPKFENTIYVALDYNGHPTSWPEISRVLEEMSQHLGNAPAINARMFDAKMVSSSTREKEWLTLRNWFKRKGKVSTRSE